MAYEAQETTELDVSDVVTLSGEENFSTFIRYMLAQDEKRELREKEEKERWERKAEADRERNRMEKEEREKKDREWMLQLEKREDERRKREFEMEERRAKREEDMRKEREEAEERRRQKGEEWREAAGLREREATLAQQRELRVVNAALLTRLPKFEGKQVPGTFIQALEKQLRDNKIPEAKWLGALESCLRGKALSTYWNLVEARDRDDYASAREAILKCLGPAITRRLDQVASYV